MYINKKRNIIYIMLILLLLLPNESIVLAGDRNDERQKPTAVGNGGAVATEHPEASEAAISILKKGGNAVDAAIAAAAVQGVTRPFSGGIGGGGVMNIYLEDEDRFLILDHRVESSENFGPDSFINPETGSTYAQSTRTSSGMATGVPSVVKAWEEALRDYGTMSLNEVLQPAIVVAESGFRADENYIRETKENASRFRKFESTIDVYLDENGEVPEVGTLMKNPDMAKTYRLIAKHGSDIFYEGEIADAIIDTIHNPPVVDGFQGEVLAGNMTMNDLRDYKVITNEATHVQYHGYDVYGPRPVSSGGINIGEILNILEPYNIGDLPQEQALHYFLEASRYAFADRRAYLGDPKYMDIPMVGLLSDGFATERRRLIKDDRATVGQVAPGNPWPYEKDPNKEPDPPSDKEYSFYYDFSGADGDPWDKHAFFRIDSIPSKHPYESSFSIEDNKGKIQLNPREQGRASDYGRVSPNMEAIKDSELLIRFKFNELGSDQRLRLWLKSDVWGSGSSFPVNGYGVELNAKTKLLSLISRKGSSSTNFGRVETALTDDWHSLRLRVHGDQVSVRLWNDNLEEPKEWDLVHQLTENQQIDNEYGNFLLSAINFDYNKGNNIFIDEITVNNLSDVSPELEDQDLDKQTDEPKVEDNSNLQLEDPQEEGSDLLDEEMPEESTIHLSVSDRDGNIVSYTSTIVSIGGNGIVVPGYGFLLNNALSGVTGTQSPDNPNYPKPRFRSLSSMAPTIVMRDGEPVMTAGAPGSATIITTVAQVIINKLDFGMTLPEAIEAPRLSQRNNLDAMTEYENVFEDKYGTVINDLLAMGHTFKPNNQVQGIGSVTGIEFLSDGQARAAAEPIRRGGGSAMAIDIEDIEEPGDDIKGSLQEIVDEINDEDLNESNYTEESWQAFQTALKIAEELLALDNEKLTQSVVDKARSNLEIAYEKLEGKNDSDNEEGLDESV